MLRFLFFFLLIFNSAMLLGQAPWAPIHPDKVYTYEYCDTLNPYYLGIDFPFLNRTDSVVCTKNILIDSVEVINQDTLFYFKRRAFPYEEIAQSSWFGTYFWDFKHPSILGYNMRVTPQNDYYFEGIDTVLLKPMDTLGASWMYKDAVTATITQIYSDSLFNQPDSFKLVQLSNGDSILLSRSFGIVKFPALDTTSKRGILTGLQKDNATWGQRSPDFWDFFDFQVGDVFYYEGGLACYECFGFTCKTKIEITNKVILPEGYLYEYEGTYRYYRRWAISSDLGPTCNNLYWDDDTLLVLKDSVIQGFDFNYIYKDFVAPGNYNFDTIFSTNNNNYVEYLSFYHPTDTNGLGKLTSISAYYLGDSIFNAGYASGAEYYYYQPQLGMTDYELNGFEHAYWLHLRGYVRNGVTIGYVQTDSQMLDVEKQPLEEEVNLLTQARIAPNPSSGTAQLLLAAARPTPLQVELFSLQGQRLRRFTLPPGSTSLSLSTDGLANGLYFIRLQGEHTQHTLKWRVQH